MNDSTCIHVYCIMRQGKVKQRQVHSENDMHWEYERLSLLKYCYQNSQLSRKENIRTHTKQSMVHKCDWCSCSSLQNSKLHTEQLYKGAQNRNEKVIQDERNLIVRK